MRFTVTPTRLDGPLLIEPVVFGDERGFFSETFRADEFAALGVRETFVQDNHSRSRRGTIRGIHFHVGEGCTKLVRCGRGAIVDVLVDLRRESPTFGQWESFELTDESMRMLYAPVGFGHGFCVTSDVADVVYKQSHYYAPDVERGISFLDPEVGIDWPVAREDWIYSDRDADAPTLAEFRDQIPLLSMDVAIVAPCPVPYVRGGAEILWRALQDHLNEATPHRAEIIKLPTREHTFWGLIAGYRDFSDLDVHEFDVVVSGKYPAWMTPHPRHVLYMLHPLRGLYETYHYFDLPDVVADAPPPVAELVDFCAAHPRDRRALGDVFARLTDLEARQDELPADLFAFPGPLIRTLVRWFDGVALAGVARHGAISHAVAARPGYFPDGADVFVAHPPTGIRREARGRPGSYLLTVGRMDAIKRTDLLVEAMALTTSKATLQVVGDGPESERLRALAASNPKVSFAGRVNDATLSQLYAGCRAVAFTAYDEDFGLVVLEGLQSGRPVVTLRDSGGGTELVEDGVSGYVVDPDPAALAAAIDRLWASRGTRRRMGQAALARSREVTWTPVVRQLEAAAGA